MSECKHGLKQGCFYCHASQAAGAGQPTPKLRSKASRLSDKMNDRMTALRQRLRQLRGE